MKPLLICDCDEVLLHMARHFGVWLDEVHDIEFKLRHGEFETSMRHRVSGERVGLDEIGALINGFFPAEMDRQTPVPHAREALDALAANADVVILTNLLEHCREPRFNQLSTHGIGHHVVCNQGPKGPAVARLLEQYRPSVAVFVDDLARHHESVADHAPLVHRLHMVSEPELAPSVPAAPFAHARIDDWREAERWIGARFEAGMPADLTDARVGD
jgi:hypothetical protein